MQHGEILIRAAVGDEPVARSFQVELLHQRLHGSEQIGRKAGIRRAQGRQGGNFFLGRITT